MIVAGMGFRATASLASLREAFLAAGGAEATMLATAENKAGTALFQAFAAECGLPVRAIARDALTLQTTITQSARVMSLYGAGSLAEAAALAGAGPKARLRAPRVQSTDGMATAALAERSLR